MNHVCDGQSLRTFRVWPIVLALVVGLAFVASIIGVFLFGYATGPNLPPNIPAGGPAWGEQRQPSDENTVNDDSATVFRELRELIATEGDEIELDVDRGGEQSAIRLTPQSQQ